VFVLTHSIPAAIGGMIVLAHPLTILGVLIVPPITSLTPVIRTSNLTAFIQIMIVFPLVVKFKRCEMTWVPYPDGGEKTAPGLSRFYTDWFGIFFANQYRWL